MSASSHPPTSLTSGTARSLRAVAVAFAAVVIAIGCHGAAGGAIPPTAATAAMLTVAAPLCWGLSAHRWSVRELVAVFLLAQSAVHLLSMATASHGAAMDMSGPLGLSVPMLVSHVAGAVLLIVMVRSGERVLWDVVEVLALRPLRLVLLVTLPAPAPRLAVSHDLHRPIARVWRSLSVERGPPIDGAPLSFA